MYILTPEQRIKIYKKINSQEIPNKISLSSTQNAASLDTIHKNDSNQESQYNVKCDKKMSKPDIDKLVSRLTANTKRQFVIKEQIERILQVNLQRKKKQKIEGKVQERLIQAGKAIQEKIQQMRIQQQKKQQALLKDKPTITQRAQKKVSAPFIQRVEDIAKEKQMLRKKLVQKYDPLFKPKLNPQSIFMAEIQNSKNFLQRVQEDREQRKQLEIQKTKQREEKQIRGLTFKPQINQNSRKMMNRLSHSSVKGTNRHKTPNNQLELEYHHPQINQKSRAIALSKQSSNRQFHERLYDDMRKIHTKKVIKREQQISKNSYRPNINKNSLRILEQKARKQSSKNKEKIDDEYEEVPFNFQTLYTGTNIQTWLSEENDNDHCEEYQQVVFGDKSRQSNAYQKQPVRRLNNVNSRVQIKNTLYPKLPR